MSPTNSPVHGNFGALETPEFEYAYYFPEGAGYLWVKHLGKGMDGTVDIVWSCVEASLEVDIRQKQGESTDLSEDAKDWVNKLFVRKKTRPMLPREEDFDIRRWPIHLPEIRNFRKHHRIPELKDWVEYHPLPADHKYHYHMISVAMIYQFCNGGTLLDVLQEYQQHQKMLYKIEGPKATRVYVPEDFIWKALGQILEVANWLHHQRPGIYHQDIHLGNVFLHFKDENQTLPDCFLGDFGRSKIMYSKSWDANGIPASRAADPKMEEYRSLVVTVKELMTLTNGTNDPRLDDRYNNMYDNKDFYSRLLYNRIRQLENTIEDCEEYRTNFDFSEIAKHMVGMGESMSGLRPESLRNLVMKSGLEPRVFPSRAELLLQPEDERPAGPWKVAKIRHDTKAVVSLSREVYRTYEPPESRFGSDYAGQWRDDDAHSIPGSDRDVSVGRL